uniref:Transcription regulator protein n=1 Tax=Ralstonia solanacearum TaxID=305 RepID=A0A0S4TS01_RALSL
MMVPPPPSASAEPLRFRARAACLPDGVLPGGFGGVRVLVCRRCPSGQAAGARRSAAPRPVGRVRFRESLVEASGNAFFIGTMQCVNRVRRLLSYRSMQHHERYPEHARQHLHILDLPARERNEAASDMMRAHLRHTLDAITNIASILEPSPA